jgi:hypothetical protein
MYGHMGLGVWGYPLEVRETEKKTLLLGNTPSTKF